MRVEILHDKIERVIAKRDMTYKEVANEIGVAQPVISRVMNKKQSWVYPDVADKISRWLAKNGEPLEKSVVSMIASNFKEIYVFGLARAATMPNPPVGDIPPSVHETDLPSIVWATTNSHKHLAGFKVDGASMEPTLKAGWTVVCDCFPTDFHNGDIVVAKFDDKAVLKRYRRVGDMISLTSENPSGESFDVHAAKIDWMLKVVGFQGGI